MSRPSLFNVQRQVIGGQGGNNVTQERRDSYFTGAAPLLHKVVVVDVICDPTRLTDAQLQNLENTVSNPEVVGYMPQNSIIGRLVSQGQDLGDSTPFVFFPFFSHVQFPVKPGEQVFVIYEDYSSQGNNSLGYWLTKVVAPQTIEDLNYTHYDRIFDPLSNPRNMSVNDRRAISPSTPGFQNGAGTPETRTLRIDSGTANPYDEIVNNASVAPLVTIEPVPRTKKRPGDFAFYGSNNTAIILGQDRSGPSLRVTGSSGVDVINKSGTIDIVAGLGGQRAGTTDNPNVDPSEANRNPTAAKAIRNTRNHLETDKQPYRKRSNDNTREGDPDFKRDLSRIYVSMRSKVDKNFGIRVGGNDGIFPDSGGLGSTKLSHPIEDLPDSGQNGQPCIVAKSEHIRLIAQGKDPTVPLDQTSAGDIRFVKTGTVADKDLSMFIMNKEGEIVAVAKNVQLQTHQDGKVFIACKNEETGNSDPIVLYSRFEELENEIMTKINALADEVNSLATGMRTILSAPGAINGVAPGVPIAALGAMIPFLGTIPGRINAYKATVDTVKNTKVRPCRSSRIYVPKDSKGNT